MLRLIRRRTTEEYLKEGGWTSDWREALQLESLAAAIGLCRDLHLRDLEVVVRFEGESPGQEECIVLVANC